MASGKKRQLNYELLRILAMLMIVSLHYLSKGGILGEPARADMTTAGYTAWLIEAFCIVAVNVYVLISGYFGVDARGSRGSGKKLTFREALRKPIKIWKQVFFYSMLFGCGALIIGVQQFDLYQFFFLLFSDSDRTLLVCVVLYRSVLNNAFSQCRAFLSGSAGDKISIVGVFTGI